MDSLYLPILIASAVALLVWGVASILKSALNGEKRKLQSRLISGEKGSSVSNSALPLSITKSTETTKTSTILIRWQTLDGLHRMIVQAYPNGTITTFMSIAGIAMF